MHVELIPCAKKEARPTSYRYLNELGPLFLACAMSFGFMAARVHWAQASDGYVQDGHWSILSSWICIPLGQLGNKFQSRTLFLALFVAWVPSLWFLVRGFASALTATVCTLLAVAWSVPLHPFPLTAWYSLFFTTFGTIALLEYFNDRHIRWIVLTGLIGGVSLLATLSGLYFLTASILCLLYDEQSVQETVQVRERKVTDSVLSVAITIALVALSTLLLQFNGARQGLTELYQFVAPGTALIFLLLAREWREPRFASPIRLWLLGTRLLPLLIGAAIPVAVVAIADVLRGNAEGVDWRAMCHVPYPTQMLHYAIHPIGAIWCAPLVIAIVLNHCVLGAWSRRIAMSVCSAGLVWLFVLQQHHAVIAGWVWGSAGTMIPLLTVAGVFLLLHGQVRGEEATRLVLFLAVAAFCGLVQVPFSAPFCFCLVAPLAILGFTQLATVGATAPRVSLLAPFAAFYAATLLRLVVAQPSLKIF